MPADTSTNKEVIWSFLRSKGLSEEAAAGVMGNIQQESNFNPESTNSKSGAYGLFQWTGGRKAGLKSYAKSQGKSASDINVQLDYFWKELNGSEKSTMGVVTNDSYSSASEYAKAFESSYERSGGSAVSKRQTYAEKILAEFHGTQYHDTSSVIQSASGSSDHLGLKWWGDVVKVVLILLLIVGGVVFFSLSFNFDLPDPGDLVKKVVK